MLEEQRPVREHALAQCRIEAVEHVTARVLPDELLHRTTRTTRRQSLLDLGLKRSSELRRVRQRLQEWRLVNEDLASHVGCAHRELQRDDGAAARPEDGRGCGTDVPQQRGRIIGLLIERGRTRRAAPGVSATIVGDDRMLRREDVGGLLEVAGVARRAGDEQHGRPSAPHFVIELSAGDSRGPAIASLQLNP